MNTSIRSIVSQLALVLALVPSKHAFSQTDQEWIKVNQSYIKIPVGKTGWYRITKKDLAEIGMKTDSLTSMGFHLFRRGKEVAITTTCRTGTLESLEFYGEMNDGSRDSALYVHPTRMPHPHYSLYSDTAYYFLTWNETNSTGKRIAQDRLSKSDTGRLYHQQKLLKVYRDEYPAGNLYPMGAGYDNGTALSTYDEGEGWTGKTMKAGDWHSLDLSVQDRCDSSAPILLELLVVGRNAGQHRAEVWVGDRTEPTKKLGEITWLNYSTQSFSTFLAPTELASDTLVTIWLKPTVAQELISVSLAELTYCQAIQFPANSAQNLFNVEPQTAYPISAKEHLTFYDVTTSTTPRQLVISHSAYHWLQDSTKKILAVRAPFRPTGLKIIHFQEIDTQRIDYLIITHPELRKPSLAHDPVEQYALYRSSSAGGGFAPLVLNSEEVFDRFNYGEPGPLGIQNLIKWFSAEGKLRFVFLIGSSRDPQSVRKLPNPRQADPIPSMGWPGSDMALTLSNNSLLVPVGRLVATSSSDVANYLEKVRQHEAQPAAAPWRKKVLHVSGGRSISELNFFRDYILQLKQRWDAVQMGVSIATLSKETDLPIESVPIAPLVNQGLALITVIGHSGLGITDVDLGSVSDPAYDYKNEGTYPAVIANGCAMGNYFYGPPPLSTNWINTPKKGAILFLAHTHNGLSNSMKRYTSVLYDVIADPRYTSTSFGQILKETIRRLLESSYSLSDLITAQQMNLQGDPAIRLFPATLPDYAWEHNTFTVTDEHGSIPSSTARELTINATLANYGRYLADSLTIRLKRLKDQELIEEIDIHQQAPLHTSEFNQRIPLRTVATGKETWELIIDPENRAREESKTNNLVTQEVYLVPGIVFPILPFSGAKVAKTAVELVAQLPTYNPGQQVVFQWSNRPDFRTFSIDTVTAQGIAAFRTITLLNADTTHYYWRVAIPGEDFSVAFKFNLAQLPDPEELPEGIAYVSPSPLTDNSDKPVFNFQNVTDIPFSDSIEVQVTIRSAISQQQRELKIPAIQSKQTYALPLSEILLTDEGNYQVVVTFNKNIIPEHIFENNYCETTVRMVTDRSPPALDVLIDGRHLTFNEAVSKESIIEVRLADASADLPVADPSLVTVQLECPECHEKLTPIRWKFHPSNLLQVYFKLPSNLANGSYKLRASGQDQRGNYAAAFLIQFRLTDAPTLTGVKVYPNPAHTWVHFVVNLEGEEIPEEWSIGLFDSRGVRIKHIPKKAHTGKNELFWFPVELCSGVYYYKIEFTNPPKSWSVTGQTNKKLHGKIVWKP
jgi:hypothetical protein